MGAPLVCVLSLTYNQQKYIEKSLESILNQRTSFPFQVCIGDDQSTDGTQKICEQFAINYPEIIKYSVNVTNLGASINTRDTFYRCFQTGAKYIAILEGDDYWADPFKLQKQVDFLEANPDYVICYHDAKIIDEAGLLINESSLPNNVKRDFSSEELIRSKFLRPLTICFRNVIAEFPEEYGNVINGDAFLISLLGAYGKGKWMGDSIKPDYYRKHASGIWSSKKEIDVHISLINTYYWMSQYYLRIGKKQYAKHFFEIIQSIIVEIDKTNKISNWTDPFLRLLKWFYPKGKHSWLHRNT